MPRVTNDVCIECFEKKDKLIRHRCEKCYIKPSTDVDCNCVVTKFVKERLNECIKCNRKLKITEFVKLGPQRVLKDGSGRIVGKRSVICNKCNE